MNYPKHLSEKIREEVAVNYLKHELRKIFPSINNQEIEQLMSCHELSNPRDFWNGLHGVSMGFKLKNILYYVTAENIRWEKRIVKINELSFGVKMEILNLGKIVKLRGNDVERENDPIIAIKKMEKQKKIIKILDGNGRLARHIAVNIDEIEVYIGHMTGNYPLNYWLPTSLLIDNLYFVYLSVENKDEELFKKQIEVLKNMLEKSESGKIEFKERALTKKEPYRSKILGEFGDLSFADN